MERAVKDRPANVSTLRSMNVLFFMRHAGYGRNFGSALDELVRRGHRVELALAGGRRSWMSKGDPDAALAARHPGVEVSESPPTVPPAWEVIARQTRASHDYLRYFEPEYEDAPKLRERARSKAAAPVRRLMAIKWARAPRIRTALAAVLRWIEQLTPWSAELDDYFAERAPDVVVVTPLVEIGAPQADIIRAARARGIPTVLCVASWDNLTNKGLIRDVPDLVTVWNEAQRREAVELHGVPPGRLVATGAQSYDHWFTWTQSTTREDFCVMTGLDPGHPYLLYLCSSGFIAPEEVDHVHELLSRMRAAGGALASAGLLIRPHPQNARQWADVDVTAWAENVALWPRHGADPVSDHARREYFDSLYHAAAVVGVNTSALIESAIVGRGVYTVLTERFAATQQGTLHFAHLAREGGGLLCTARSWDEHLQQLKEALVEPRLTRHKSFLEAFVRPRGLDTPAAPVLVDALERAAAAPAAAPSPTPRMASVARPLLGGAGAGALVWRRFAERRLRRSRRLLKRWSGLRRAVSRRSGRRIGGG
jgi:hypothetical protein